MKGDTLILFRPFLCLTQWNLSVFHEYIITLRYVPSTHSLSFIIKGYLHQSKRSCGVCSWVHLCGEFCLLIYLCWTVPASLGWSQLDHSEWSFGCVLEFDLQVFCGEICIHVHQPIHKTLFGIASCCLLPQFTPRQPHGLCQPHPHCRLLHLPTFSGRDSFSSHPHNLFSHIL